jgi:hypothetical protein
MSTLELGGSVGRGSDPQGGGEGTSLGGVVGAGAGAGAGAGGREPAS